jgi:hypothetical protein
MPRIRPLSPDEAKRTLANRLGPRVDRLRQFSTNFGLRPYRVFLVWTRYSGDERGEGDEHELRRVEVLPTPRVTALDNLTYGPVSTGVLPSGSVRIDRVSTTFTEDQLMGRLANGDSLPNPRDFFYEIVEDGRTSEAPARLKFRPLSNPALLPGKQMWTLMLERISEDRTRAGKSRAGDDE